MSIHSYKLYQESVELALSGLVKFGLEEYQDQIAQLALPAYKILCVSPKLQKQMQSQAKVGIFSKIGGKPDLPVGFEWPVENDRPLAFFAQINLADVHQISHPKAEIELPVTGVISIFLPLQPDQNHDYIELDWDNLQNVKIFLFKDLFNLERREFPEGLSLTQTFVQTEYKRTSNHVKANPKYNPNKSVTAPPVLKADADGSFTSYFKALNDYIQGKKSEYNSDLRLIPAEIQNPELEKFESVFEKSVDLIVDEILLQFSPISSFPFWGESELYLKAGIPKILESNLDAWCNWWWEKNDYRGSCLLGYPTSCQGVFRDYYLEKLLQRLPVKTKSKNKKLCHLLSFGDDFEDFLTNFGLAATNNFYIFQKPGDIPNYETIWLEVNSD
ncbi:MAG: hypothetical protein OHK0017_06240 [Patescibacteria group bacterium]